MDEEFVDQTRVALKRAQKLQYRELGEIQRLRDLQWIENRMLSSPEHSPVYFGNAIKNLLWEAIDTLEPPFPEDLYAPAWRIYIVLRDHIKRGEQWEPVSRRLGVGESVFQEIKRDAGELVASRIWEWEEKARFLVMPRDNLPAQSFIFDGYIERLNEFDDKPIIQGFEKDDSLVEIIVELLKGKPWIISLNGPSGVGKTSLAYEVARQCKERRTFEAVIWASAKKRTFVVRPPVFAQIPLMETVNSCEDVLDTIAHVLEYRAVSGTLSMDEKLRIVDKLLREHNCLVIVDNLEEFTIEALDQLSVFLRTYTGLSKVLLTSRRVISIGDYLVDVPGLSFDESCQLMRQKCTLLGLHALTAEDKQYLYEKSKGNPLAISCTLGALRSYGFSLQTAIERFIGDKVVLNFMWGEAYKQLQEEDKKALLIMPIFSPHTASFEAIRVASQLDSSRATLALGTLYNLNFVTRDGSRYLLRGTSIPEFLRGLGEDQLDEMLLSEFRAKAYIGLAQYYIATLGEKPTMDQKLRFLSEGQGDEKWIILQTLQGCRALAEANLDLEGCRPLDAWGYIIDLYDLIGQPLGILAYFEERLRWAKQACLACQMLGDQRKAAWFEVFDIGRTHLVLGNTQKARDIFATNLTLAEQKGWKAVHALALHNLAWIAREEGDLCTAENCLTQALALWPECGPQYGDRAVYAMSALALTKQEQAQNLEGDDRESKLLEMRTLLEKSVELRRKMGSIDAVAEGLSEMSLAYGALEMWDEAWLLTEQASQLAKEIPPPSVTLAYVLRMRARLWELQGNIEAAMKDARLASDVYQAVGAEYLHSSAKVYRHHLEESLSTPVS